MKLSSIPGKPLLLPALILFLTVIMLMFASLHLEVLRHERMVPALNAALKQNGLSPRIASPGRHDFLPDAARYRSPSAPSVLRFSLEDGAGVLWVFVVRAGGLDALLMMVQFADGSFSSPLPCDEVSARQADLLPPGLVKASLVRVKKLAGGYVNE